MAAFGSIWTNQARISLRKVAPSNPDVKKKLIFTMQMCCQFITWYCRQSKLNKHYLCDIFLYLVVMAGRLLSWMGKQFELDQLSIGIFAHYYQWKLLAGLPLSVEWHSPSIWGPLAWQKKIWGVNLLHVLSPCSWQSAFHPWIQSQEGLCLPPNLPVESSSARLTL